MAIIIKRVVIIIMTPKARYYSHCKIEERMQNNQHKYLWRLKYQSQVTGKLTKYKDFTLQMQGQKL